MLCYIVQCKQVGNIVLVNIKFGSKLLSIGANVFVKDTHNDLMQSVTIPDSVKSVGEGAFGYYKDSDMNYAELCKEAERLGVTVQSLMAPTVANADFVLYGGTAAKRYANENGMNYGGAAAPSEVIEAKAGDLNGDTNINLKDVVMLRRAIAGGWNVDL